MYSVPKVLKYEEEQCDTIEYATESKTVVGPIKEVKVISKGFNYKALPKFTSVNSSSGENANIVALSTSIGRVNQIRIVDIGYEYSSDKTLSPEAFVSPVVRIDNLDTVKSVRVVDGGKEYLSPPDVIVYDPISDTIVDSTSLVAKTPNQSISEVDVIAPIQGLNSVNHKIKGSYQDILDKRQEFENIASRVRDLDKTIKEALKAQTFSQLDDYLNQAVNNTLVLRLEAVDKDALKPLADRLLDHLKGGFVFLANVNGSKVTFIAKSDSDKYHSGKLAKEAAMICGGNGGGRPQMAQAGGKDVTKVDEAIAKIKELIQ